MSRFRNYYRCPRCDYDWQDEYDAQPDDDCPNCGMRHVSPHRSEDVDDEEEERENPQPMLYDQQPQPKNAFWKMQRMRPNVVPDPLGYNSQRGTYTSPDYVAEDDFRRFIAYGLLECWLDPTEFSYWYLLCEPDIQWHRECFLTIVEQTIEGIWDGTFEPGEESFDFGSNGDELDIMPVGYEERMDRDEEVNPVITLAWRPTLYEEENVDVEELDEDGRPLDEPDPAIGFQCCYNIHDGPACEDGPVIWVRRSAIMDKDRVAAVLAEARRVNDWRGWGDEIAKERAKPPTKERIIDLHE